MFVLYVNKWWLASDEQWDPGLGLEYLISWSFKGKTPAP